MPQLKRTDTTHPRPATARDVVAAAEAGNKIFEFHLKHNRLPNKEELAFFAEHQRFPTESELAATTHH